MRTERTEVNIVDRGEPGAALVQRFEIERVDDGFRLVRRVHARGLNGLVVSQVDLRFDELDTAGKLAGVLLRLACLRWNAPDALFDLTRRCVEEFGYDVVLPQIDR